METQALTEDQIEYKAIEVANSVLDHQFFIMRHATICKDGLRWYLDPSKPLALEDLVREYCTIHETVIDSRSEELIVSYKCTFKTLAHCSPDEVNRILTRAERIRRSKTMAAVVEYLLSENNTGDVGASIAMRAGFRPSTLAKTIDPSRKDRFAAFKYIDLKEVKINVTPILN